MRERLRKHRDSPQCARCHKKIDPLGFALENFDGCGSWREQEGSGRFGLAYKWDAKVDPAAKLPDGTEVNGVDGLKQELLKRADQFRRTLARKMATYALRRELGFADDEWVEQLATNTKQSGDTLRALVQEIVKSERFRTK